MAIEVRSQMVRCTVKPTTVASNGPPPLKRADSVTFKFLKSALFKGGGPSVGWWWVRIKRPADSLTSEI